MKYIPLLDQIDFLQIQVKDNGVGIKEDLIPLLFQLFPDHANEKELCLGLVTSKMIVEKFSGAIDCLSGLGQGTTFTFTFEVQRQDIEE